MPGGLERIFTKKSGATKLKNKTLEQHRPEVWKGPKQRKEKNAKQSNIARMFGKDLNKKKTNAKGKKTASSRGLKRT